MTEDRAYYQLKELIRDEMLEQSPNLAKIMVKYKAITAAKDAEIAALQMQIRVEGAINGKEIEALRAENERLRAGIESAMEFVNDYNDYGVPHKEINRELQAILDAKTEIYFGDCPNCSNGKCSKPESFAICHKR